MRLSPGLYSNTGTSVEVFIIHSETEELIIEESERSLSRALSCPSRIAGKQEIIITRPLFNMKIILYFVQELIRVRRQH